MPEDGVELRPKNQFMRTEEVLSIAKTFTGLGVKKIRLTGGEPLIRKDADTIIRGLSKLPVELGITTNGIIVDRFIGLFKESNVRSINLSLDTMQRAKMERITRRDYFDKIMSNIELLRNEGFHVKVNMVVMRGTNDDEITDFIEWSRNEPIHVRFIEFMPFGGNNWDWNQGVSHDEILSRTTERFGAFGFERITDRPNDTSKNYRLKEGKGTFAVISSVTNPFCDTCNRIRLTADGKLKNCLFSNSEIDLLEAFRKGNDITPLITESIQKKKEIRSGMNTFEQLSDPNTHERNRSMVAIGG
jgi:cyclic pyranopterin phosphate synthase